MLYSTHASEQDPIPPPHSKQQYETCLKTHIRELPGLHVGPGGAVLPDHQWHGGVAPPSRQHAPSYVQDHVPTRCLRGSNVDQLSLRCHAPQLRPSVRILFEWPHHTHTHEMEQL